MIDARHAPRRRYSSATFRQYDARWPRAGQLLVDAEDEHEDGELFPRRYELRA